MKSVQRKNLVTFNLILGLGLGSPALGDTPSVKTKEKTMKAVATSIDPAGKEVWVKNFWGTKRLNVADDCKILLPDKPGAGLEDLRAGQKLVVTYEMAEGVPVAHQFEQRILSFTGVVMAIDPSRRIVIVRHHALDKTFRIADACKISSREAKAGTLTDLKPGQHVRVIYEVPRDQPTARQIAQFSATFSGSLTAIDLSERTLKAKTLVGEEKFALAHDCAVVLDGKPGGKLRDLKLGEKLVLNYDDVNGVNIVNRISTGAAERSLSTTASVQSQD